MLRRKQVHFGNFEFVSLVHVPRLRGCCDSTLLLIRKSYEELVASCLIARRILQYSVSSHIADNGNTIGAT